MRAIFFPLLTWAGILAIATAASAQAPATAAVPAMPGANVGTAGMQDMTPGATVTGVGPGGSMGSQAPVTFTFGANASTANAVDRTMGDAVTGQGGVMRGALPTARGTNFTTVYGRDMRAGAIAAMGQFGANNAQLGPVPNINGSTATGRQIQLESGALSGGATTVAGTYNGPQLGMGTNANTAGMNDMRAGSVASMGMNAALNANYWASAAQGGRNWSRGVAGNLPAMAGAGPMQFRSMPAVNVPPSSFPAPTQVPAMPSPPQAVAPMQSGYFGGGLGSGLAPTFYGNVQNANGAVGQPLQR